MLESTEGNWDDLSTIRIPEEDLAIDDGVEANERLAQILNAGGLEVIDVRRCLATDLDQALLMDDPYPIVKMVVKVANEVDLCQLNCQGCRSCRWVKVQRCMEILSVAQGAVLTDCGIHNGNGTDHQAELEHHQAAQAEGLRKDTILSEHQQQQQQQRGTNRTQPRSPDHQQLPWTPAIPTLVPDGADEAAVAANPRMRQQRPL